MVQPRKNSPPDLTYVLSAKDLIGKQAVQNLQDQQIQIMRERYAQEIVGTGFPGPNQFLWTVEDAGGDNRKKMNSTSEPSEKMTDKAHSTDNAISAEGEI